MEITFLGATGTVTGSKYLVEAAGQRLLIDCGLFQGLKELRLRNWDQLPVEPSSIDEVILTHAHIDHSGYLPLLIRDGFLGKVRCTHATRDLCALLLPDSGHLQEEEAAYANRRGFSKHRPALPLYTKREGQAALWHFFPILAGAEVKLGGGLSYQLLPAGHMLGAAMVRVRYGPSSLLFTGDLGRPNDPIMPPPARVQAADYLVIESTYGDRLHPAVTAEEVMSQLISRVARRGGVVVVPAFSVGRTQELLFVLSQLKAAGRIPDIPVYLNSPMAIDATEIYRRYPFEHRLSAEQCRAMCEAATIVSSAEESKALNERQGPMLLIAGSGMATGGRVLHHLKAFAPDPKNAILLSGYQAAGTRGARIAAGEETIKIHGEQVPVRAEVVQLEGLSAHADYAEILDWLRGFERPPHKTFITHGEPAAAAALGRRIREELGWSCYVPSYLERVQLTEEPSRIARPLQASLP